MGQKANLTVNLLPFRVGKLIVPSDPTPQDINLNSDLFVLWGIRPDNSTAGMIPPHRIATPSDIPAASLVTVNPAGPAVALVNPVSHLGGGGGGGRGA